MRPPVTRRRRRFDQLPDVLSVAEAAEALGVSPATIHYWLRAGELVSLELSGNRRLVPKAQLLDLVERAGSRRRSCGEAPGE